MTTSKVKIIHGVNKWDGQNGTLYFHDIEMENGDRGSIGKKKENAFTVGQELKYTLEPDKRNEGKFKIVEEKKEFQGKGGDYKRNYKADFISFAMSYSKDLAVAGKIDMVELRDNASSILKWMNTKYDDLQSSKPQDTNTTYPTGESTKPPVSNSAMISDAQVKYIMSLWTDLKLENSEELRKKYLKHKYNTFSTKDLTKEQASEFISDIKIKQSKITLEGEHGSKKDPNDDLPF